LLKHVDPRRFSQFGCFAYLAVTEIGYWRVFCPRTTHTTRSPSETYPVPAELGRLGRDIDPIEAGGVFAQDLALDLKGQIDVILLFQIPLPKQEFDATVDAFFAHPQTSVRGWEPAADAQARIIRAVEQIASQAGNGDLAIVGHGGTGTLLYCHLAGLPIDRRYDQPATSGGNWFAFNAVTRKLMVHGWHSIDATGQEGTSPAAAAGRAWGVNTDDS
jgi:hypothetical protein